MDQADMQRFAARWIAHWNARDLDAILAPFAEDCRFISPLAAEVTGNAVVVGKAALHGYWQRALTASADLHFTLIAALCDVPNQQLAVHYHARRNGQTRRALETMDFVAGRQVRGESFYGAFER